MFSEYVKAVNVLFPDLVLYHLHVRPTWDDGQLAYIVGGSVKIKSLN